MYGPCKHTMYAQSKDDTCGTCRGVSNPVTVGAAFLSGQQLFVEGRVPITQSLDGPQLENSWSINVGWQWMFWRRLTPLNIRLVYSTETALPIRFHDRALVWRRSSSMGVHETRRDCSRREALIRPEEPIRATSSSVARGRISPWTSHTAPESWWLWLPPCIWPHSLRCNPSSCARS